MAPTNIRGGLKRSLSWGLIYQTSNSLEMPINLRQSSDTSQLSTQLDVGSYFQPSIQGVETALSFISAVLVTATYTILISGGARLASTSKLPLVSIEDNIGSLLSRVWPDHSYSTAAESLSEKEPPPDPDAIRLLYVGEMDKDDRRVARGLRQSNAKPDQSIDRPALWITGGSPITKSVVQLMVWEWLSMWLVVITVFTTLLYNGFITGDLAPDSYPRLAVALIYFSSYCVHALYVWRSCTIFFTLVGAGAAWSMLNRANFAVLDQEQLQNHLNGSITGSKLEFRQIDKASAEFIPATYLADLAHKMDADRDNQAPKGEQSDAQKEVKAALATINAIQGTERTNATKAATCAHDRIVANAMIMLGINISYGFSVWTGRILNADSTELGSLALLASLSIGVGTMFSSAVQLNIMNSSYEVIVRLKEVKINGHAVEYIKKRVSRTKAIGFTQGTLKARPVRIRDMLKGSKLTCGAVLGWLLFGPGFALLPSEADERRQSPDTQFALHAQVRGERVDLTTGTTDRHLKDENGINAEAINVCFRPKSRTGTPQNPEQA